jgi:hypothetical protein
MNRRALVALAGLALIGITADARFSYAGDPQAPTSGAGVITLKGAEKDVSYPVRLSAGAYLITSTGGGGLVTFTVKQGDAPVYVTMFNPSNQADLFSVGDTTVKAGAATFEVSGIEAWTVTVTRVDGAGAGMLPQVLSAAEMNAAISKPFKAAAGNLSVAYTYKGKPKGTGTILICDITTGKMLQTPMMYAGRDTGTLTVPVPAAGVFIALTRFPLASGGGQVKISQ